MTVEGKEKTAERHKGALSLLSKNDISSYDSPDLSILEAFNNTHVERDYRVVLDCPEFTSLCPITGQPDFGHIEIEYVPDKLCVESKSLKLYLRSFRNHGAFHEEVINRICDDLDSVMAPRRMVVTGRFNTRGGIAITVEASSANASRQDGAETSGPAPKP